MKIERSLFFITVFLIYIMATRQSIDTDTWWHLRAGKWMIENRQIITTDYFSYTRYGAEWRYPGWLIEVPMAWIEGLAGLGSLNILTGIIIAVAFAILYFTIQVNEFLRSFLLILVATVSGVYWSTRPHLFTLLFTAIFLYLLEKGAKKGYSNFHRVLWVVFPFLMLCWVNIHGGFIVGFILWGIYVFELIAKKAYSALVDMNNIRFEIFDKDLRALMLTGVIMVLVAGLNPLGYQIFLYPFKTVSIQVLRQFIQEWQSPNFHAPSTQPFLWLLILLVWVAAFSKRRWLFRDVLLVSVYLYLALLAWRNVALFALVAYLPIARNLSDFGGREFFSQLLGRNQRTRVQGTPKEHPQLNLLIVVLVFMGCIYRTHQAYSEKNIQSTLLEFYPVGAVRYLAENQPQGRLFNSYNWGAYLLWYLPEYPVFVDGRTDLYNDEILTQWFQVAQMKEGWDQVIERWQIRTVLMEKDWIMANFLQQNGWCLRYQDEVAVVLEKCR